MNRRKFIQLTAGSIIGATGAAKAPRRELKHRSDPDRPNILFIMTDQQYAGAMSNAGDPYLSTPAMDLIAANGVAFERAYCTNPICVPSRTSLLTGRMPHETTVTFNTYEHPIACPPLSPLMKQAGYRTGYVGKWHIPHEAEDRDWHGFDFVAHARKNRLDPDVPGAVDAFLHEGGREAPFFLVASFVNPHDICEWARTAAGIPDPLPNGTIPEAPDPASCPPLPANHEIPENEPEVIRAHQGKLPRVYPTIGWPSERWRQYQWAYHRLVEKVDGQIAKVLESLRQSGQWENTVVIFTSDHGDGMGAHRWNQKTLFYEEVARVPMIVADLRRKGGGARDRESLVSMNLDFFPTVFDYAGIPLPEDFEGKSLRPLVEQRPGASGHPFVVSQNDLHEAFGFSGGVFGRMIRTDRFKYICFSEGKHPEQLFDLVADPGEMDNLAGQSSHASTLERHRQILSDWIEEHDDFFSIPASVRTG